MRRPLRLRSGTSVALLTSVRKSGQRTKNISLTPPKPPIAKFAQAKRGFGMTEKEEEKSQRLKPVPPGGPAGSRRYQEEGERPGQKKRRGWPRRLCKTKFGNGTGLLALLGSFLVCLLGFLCHAKSPSLVQSVVARVRNAHEWQSFPLPLVYGCPRQVSRKFRVVRQKKPVPPCH